MAYPYDLQERNDNVSKDCEIIPFLIYLRRRENERRFELAFFQLERAPVISLLPYRLRALKKKKQL